MRWVRKERRSSEIGGGVTDVAVLERDIVFQLGWGNVVGGGRGGWGKEGRKAGGRGRCDGKGVERQAELLHLCRGGWGGCCTVLYEG